MKYITLADFVIDIFIFGSYTIGFIDYVIEDPAISTAPELI